MGRNSISKVRNFLARGKIPSMNILRLATTVADGETVTINGVVFEVDTHDASTITAGRTRLDLHAGATVKSQGTLTIAEPVTADDTMTIGTTTYTFKAGATALALQIGLGGSEAATKLAIVAAIKGLDGFNTAHPLVTCATAFTADTLVITAKKGGVAGDLIATTEGLTHASNVFDSTTLGTTTAGVNPSAADFVTAFVAAVNLANTGMRAVSVTAGEVLVYNAAGGHEELACTETLGGSNNAWASATAFGGIQEPDSLPAPVIISRVPTATEVALQTMYFPFNFEPTYAAVQIRSSVGLPTITFNGHILIEDNLVKVVSDGSADIGSDDIVTVLAF